jgi:hypothetical protein
MDKLGNWPWRYGVHVELNLIAVRKRRLIKRAQICIVISPRKEQPSLLLTEYKDSQNSKSGLTPQHKLGHHFLRTYPWLCWCC